MIMVSVFSVQLSPYALLLLAVTLGADNCINKNCDKTWIIPSNEDLTIKLSPCDQCTNCDSPFETQTVRAWWSYQLPNGSWTEQINATVINKRDYEIKLLDHSSLVTKGPHIIHTSYEYHCEGLSALGGTLKGIEITLTAAGASIDCNHEMPVLEGRAVEIWCKTGLSDSRVVESSFHFRGRAAPCPLQHNPNPNPNPAFGGYSRWTVNRKATEPYTCELQIENIQPSDSGDYYCEVDVHEVYIMGTPTPVKSHLLHIEVTSNSPNSTSTPLILEIVIPVAGVGLVLLVVILMVCCGVCYYCGRRHHDNHQPQPLPDGPHHPLVENPQPPGDGGYGALSETPALSGHSGRGSVEQSRSTEHGTGSIRSSRRSDPNEMNRSGAELPHGLESDVNSI